VTSLAMIRHGPTEWTKDKRLQGRTDIPLSDAGRELVSQWRIPPAPGQYRWVCSPLSRARETAELLGAKDLEIEPRLIEMNYGKWEGQRLKDLRETLGEEMAENEARGLDFLPEGGESPRNVQKRLTPWLAELASEGRPIVAVAHHGIIRALFSLATGWDMVGAPPEKFRWGAMNFFRIAEDGRVSVDRINVSISAAS
jgi:broad specificity phosphatase PhoE